jgi:hypothetical protein
LSAAAAAAANLLFWIWAWHGTERQGWNHGEHTPLHLLVNSIACMDCQTCDFDVQQRGGPTLPASRLLLAIAVYTGTRLSCALAGSTPLGQPRTTIRVFTLLLRPVGNHKWDKELLLLQPLWLCARLHLLHITDVAWHPSIDIQALSMFVLCECVYVLQTAGNHEWDKGLPALKQYLDKQDNKAVLGTATAATACCDRAAALLSPLQSQSRRRSAAALIVFAATLLLSLAHHTSNVIPCCRVPALQTVGNHGWDKGLPALKQYLRCPQTCQTSMTLEAAPEHCEYLLNVCTCCRR